MTTFSTWLGLIVALGGPPLVALHGTRLARHPQALATNLLGQLALLALLAIVFAITFVWEHALPAALGLRPPGLSTLGWGLGIAAVFVTIGPVLRRIPARLGLAGFERPLADLARLPVWYLILAVLVGGTVEELLYRGFALARVAALTGSYGIAGALTVGLAGLAHVPSWGWGPAITTLISGGILTVVYLWHRDIGANIIGHVVTDFIGIALGPLLAYLCATHSKTIES